MTSSSNHNADIRLSANVGTEELEDDFLLTMKTFDFTIINDDIDLDLPSQVTNPSSIIPAPSNVELPFMRPSPSQQPTAEILRSLGIKVRDFAHESTLPPITPIPRVPRQTQPSARLLKRSNRDWEEDIFGVSSRASRPRFGSEASNGGTEGDRKTKSLVRKPTEPLEFDPTPVTRRAMGCADLSRPFLLGSQIPFRTPRRASPNKRSGSPATSPLFGSPSPGSEIVMGAAGGVSWHIQDTRLIPASKLDSVPTEICRSQLGISPQGSQVSTTFLSPMRSSLALHCISPPSHAVNSFDTSHLISQIPKSPRGARRGVKTPTIKASTEAPPRYLLRRRSLLSSHAPTRSRYPHPLTHAKKGNSKASSPRSRCRRLQKSVLSR